MAKTPFHLKNLDEATRFNPLLQRRQAPKTLNETKVTAMISATTESGETMPFDPNQICVHCHKNFTEGEEAIPLSKGMYHKHCHSVTFISCDRCGQPVENDVAVSHGNRFWHRNCFMCAQCFRHLADEPFYEINLDGSGSLFLTRYYCQKDFELLFAHICGGCNRSIVDGECIRLHPMSFHAACFSCFGCGNRLKEHTRNGVIVGKKLYCLVCHDKLLVDQPICAHCGKPTSPSELIRHKGVAYHAHHLPCSSCRTVLDKDAKELHDQLFCVPCYDKAVLVCGACRRALTDGRRVFALKKYWHVEHFVCAQCESPFLGRPYYEHEGKAYCELDYHQLYGHICYQCCDVIKGAIFTAFDKSWCADCFCCTSCSRHLTKKTKFYPLDRRPVCGPCFDLLPDDLQKVLMKYSEESYWGKDGLESNAN